MVLLLLLQHHGADLMLLRHVLLLESTNVKTSAANKMGFSSSGELHGLSGAHGVRVQSKAIGALDEGSFAPCLQLAIIFSTPSYNLIFLLGIELNLHVGSCLALNYSALPLGVPVVARISYMKLDDPLPLWRGVSSTVSSTHCNGD
jgi:hypothetical protein